MYLHRDKETFKDMAGQAADSNGRTPAIVEKDYALVNKNWTLKLYFLTYNL
jgi:hypothetical protein